MSSGDGSGHWSSFTGHTELPLPYSQLLQQPSSLLSTKGTTADYFRYDTDQHGTSSLDIYPGFSGNNQFHYSQAQLHQFLGSDFEATNYASSHVDNTTVGIPSFLGSHTTVNSGDEDSSSKIIVHNKFEYPTTTTTYPVNGISRYNPALEQFGHCSGLRQNGGYQLPLGHHHTTSASGASDEVRGTQHQAYEFNSAVLRTGGGGFVDAASSIPFSTSTAGTGVPFGGIDYSFLYASNSQLQAGLIPPQINSSLSTLVEPPAMEKLLQHKTINRGENGHLLLTKTSSEQSNIVSNTQQLQHPSIKLQPRSTLATRRKELTGMGVLAMMGQGTNAKGNRATFSCEICCKQYCRKSTLKAHVKYHLGGRIFTCQICNKSFSQAANLTAHKRVHTGEKPFFCSVCLRPFSQSSSLVTHKRTHTGEKPYKCKHVSCDKAFTDSSTLTKHLRTHTGNKPYSCSLCMMKFSQSGNLHRHMKTHSRKNND